MGRRVALIVANGAYRDAALANPVDRRQSRCGEPGKVGFTVTVKKNLALDEFEEALAEFGETDARRRRRAVLLCRPWLFDFHRRTAAEHADGDQRRFSRQDRDRAARRRRAFGTRRGNDHRPRPRDLDVHRRMPRGSRLRGSRTRRPRLCARSIFRRSTAPSSCFRRGRARRRRTDPTAKAALSRAPSRPFCRRQNCASKTPMRACAKWCAPKLRASRFPTRSAATLPEGGVVLMSAP